MNLNEYSEQLLQETIAAADADPDGGLRAETFTKLIAERLIDAGEFSEAQVAHFQQKGIEVSGWSNEDDDPGTLHLFVTDYRSETPPLSLTATSMATSFKRVTEFFSRCLDGYADRIEESSPVFELAEMIGRNGSGLERLRLYLFSDARARDPKFEDSTTAGIPTSHHVWDLERLHRLDTSGMEHEPIAVDITNRLGSPIPCLVGPVEGDHQVFLAVVPGEFLANLYGEFGARLLERNVRAFLQARGAVNRGIRETLQREPEYFLAYNNGISATAAKIELVEMEGGGTGISDIWDFQVVNGGQTTASLHAAMKRDKVDLSKTNIQVKLTVVAPDRIDEMVPFISKYSNTQNKVTGADFSANHPFHVRLEELSRTIWAPAGDGSQRQTHWFYERARGQYADEYQRARTPAQQRQFKLMNPSQQKFTKTDLAKFYNSWDQRPHTVSLGAEKNFREFMLELDSNGTPMVDADYFEKVVAKAILFRATEKIVSAQRFGGYRANIVTYTIAKLVRSTAHRIDLSQIWRTQSLTPAMERALEDLCRPVHDVIVNPSGKVRHIGEWSKKLDCWKRVEELQWSVPKDLAKELIALHSVDSVSGSTSAVAPSDLNKEDAELVTRAVEISADAWFGISNWAKETSNLQGWQRSLAYSLGKLAAQGRPPSVKQARQGLVLVDEAKRLGYS